MEATKGKYIAVDEFQQTSAKGVYALGDVCGKIELTPVAIAAGRRLADRLAFAVELWSTLNLKILFGAECQYHIAF